MGRLVHVIACAATLLGSLAPAAAQDALPTVGLRVDGACPGEAQLRRSLTAETLVVATESDWAAHVWRVGETTHLRLRGPGGVAVTREIASDDCDAIADAVALIVAAQLGGVPGALPDPDVRGPSARPIDPAAAPDGEIPEADTRGPSARPLGDDDRRTAAAAEDAAPVRDARRSEAPGAADPPAALRASPTDSPPPAADGPGAGGRWQLGIAGGVGLALDGGDDGRSLQIDGGAILGGHRVRVALSHDTTGMRSVGAMLHRTQTTVRAELAWRRSAGPVWLRPGVGAGLASSEVRPQLVGADAVRRLHPVVTGTVAAGLALGESLSLRAELGALVFPVNDRYTLEMLGNVGESPRATASATMGVEASWGK